MKIVLNTHAEDPGSIVCITGLHQRLLDAGVEATLNDWDHYERYDVAVFMAYDEDMAAARKANPKIRIAAADPKQSAGSHLRVAREADFLMVSSVEQRDVFYRHNRNILIYYMFPPMRPVDRVHVDREPIVIGYHGNRVHLECMVESVKPALHALAKNRRVEFWAIYNVARSGRAVLGLPDPAVMPVRHIQWSRQAFYDELARVDIGVMPNAIPIRDRLSALETTAYPEPEFVYEPFDHLVRYKASSNPGRLYPYAQLGIPVVADFAPSASQLIRDGESGFIASSPHAWFEALDALAASAALRNAMARRLREIVRDAYGRQVPEFLAFCSTPLKSGPAVFAGEPTAEDELARMGRFARPSAGGPLKRIGMRLKRVMEKSAGG
jgi:hypothetical protein